MLTNSQLTESLHKKRLGRLDILLVVLPLGYKKAKMIKDIKLLGRNAGFPEILKWNIADTLKKSKGNAIRIPDGWILTESGRIQVNSLGIIPEQHSSKTINLALQLRKDLKGIKNEDSKEFLLEAIEAFESRLYRSCVVLSWVGAVSLLYDKVINTKLSQFNAEAKRINSKWKNAVIKDDLSRMKESEFLDIIGSPPLSILGKNVKEELKDNCLRLRNSCGHPNSLKFGENRVASHLEILILNIYKQFS